MSSDSLLCWIMEGMNAHNVDIVGFLDKLRLCLFFPLHHVPTGEHLAEPQVWVHDQWNDKEY